MRHALFYRLVLLNLLVPAVAVRIDVNEQTMRWFILVVALLLDPAAVLLLLAATQGRQR